MRRILRRWTRANRLQLAALAAAAVLAAGSGARAWQLGALPVSSAGAGALHVGFPDVSVSKASQAGILAAVDRAPFRPDRKRPPGRYRMPGEVVVAAAPAPSGPPMPIVRLEGIASRSGVGSLAILSSPGQPTRLVRAGQTFQGLKVVRIQDGRITLRGRDSTLVLRLGTPTHQPQQ